MQQCCEAGCTQSSRTRGFCKKHYDAWRWRSGKYRRAHRRNATSGPVFQSWSSTPKPTKSPTVRDLEWAAGFIEGEGSFFTSRIEVGQVHKPPVERLQQLFGGSLVARKASNPKHSDFWCWRACGARGRGVMMTLYTLLSPKRQSQIRKVMETW